MHSQSGRLGWLGTATASARSYNPQPRAMPNRLATCKEVEVTTLASFDDFLDPRHVV